MTRKQSPELRADSGVLPQATNVAALADGFDRPVHETEDNAYSNGRHVPKWSKIRSVLVNRGNPSFRPCTHVLVLFLCALSEALSYPPIASRASTESFLVPPRS